MLFKKYSDWFLDSSRRDKSIGEVWFEFVTILIGLFQAIYMDVEIRKKKNVLWVPPKKRIIRNTMAKKTYFNIRVGHPKIVVLGFSFVREKKIKVPFSAGCRCFHVFLKFYMIPFEDLLTNLDQTSW